MALNDPAEVAFEAIATERGVRGVQVAWHADYVSATQIGRRIAELDREVRRAATDTQHADSPTRVPRPQDGGLAFVDAAPGSADILFDVFGFVRDVLASDALKVLLTAIGLTGAIGKVWGYLFRDRDPLAGVSGREVLEILRAYHELQGAPEGAEVIGEQPAEPDSAPIRISILVEHDDGARSIVNVEMTR